MNVTKPQLKNFFVFSTSHTHFLFNDKIYDQTKGVAMGSTLDPALANLIMGYHTDEWLNSEEIPKLLFYKRYEDDIFWLFKSKTDAQHFLTFLNGQHFNINFPIENKKKQSTSIFRDFNW